jgi:hypothetical protein
MTLQTSGPITFAEIQTEFGGSNPIGLNEYYSGGAYVPPYTYGFGAFPIPSSGPINIADFYGTTKNVSITLPTLTMTVSAITDGPPSVARAEFNVNPNGRAYGVTSGATSNNTTSTELHQWCSPTQAAPGFEVRVSGVIGTPLSGSAVDTWLPLTSTRSWFIVDDSLAALTSSFTVEIGRRDSSTAIATGSVDLEATQI